MDHRLAFHDVVPRHHKYHRASDLDSFEFTYKAEVTSIYKLTELENIYRIRIMDNEDRRHFSFRPGQFVILEIPGIGEAPFSISSSPSNLRTWSSAFGTSGTSPACCPAPVAACGSAYRGPFGTSFLMERMHGGNILLIAGGLGLVPLRSPIAHVQEHRSMFDHVDIIYGTKDPSRLLFRPRAGCA